MSIYIAKKERKAVGGGHIASDLGWIFVKEVF